MSLQIGSLQISLNSTPFRNQPGNRHVRFGGGDDGDDDDDDNNDDDTPDNDTHDNTNPSDDTEHNEFETQDIRYSDETKESSILEQQIRSPDHSAPAVPVVPELQLRWDDLLPGHLASDQPNSATNSDRSYKSFTSAEGSDTDVQASILEVTDSINRSVSDNRPDLKAVWNEHIRVNPDLRKIIQGESKKHVNPKDSPRSKNQQRKRKK